MVQVSSSAGSHTCGRLGSGAVLCWGNNGSGQLGDGTTTARRDPVPVVGLTDAVDVAAGSTHTCAVRARGEVVCWGSNFYGELGDNSRTQRLVPTPVAWARGTPVDVEAGYYHSCARREDGSVVCWGQNGGGLLGDGSEVTHRAAPFPVTAITDARALGLAGSHACVLRATGEVACWGTLPRSASAPVVNHRTPTTLPGLADVVEIVVASDHDCARLADGSVVCWGHNQFGMLGDGTTVDRVAPTRVVGLP